ncbi:carbohydrate ABC transporter permease [Micromonospora echinospora]|uniref:carbohydrate ABC transporter permease n=1 Tax=Micromonospora echinospora TaxID=1877 RepID=UPI0033C28CA2
MRHGIKHRMGLTGAVTVVLALVGLAVFPFYWMLVTATRTDDELFGDRPPLLPDLSGLSTFADVFSDTTVVGWLTNSAMIAAGTTLLTMILAVPIAYAMSRFSFRGKVLVGIGLLVTQMLPEAVLVVPLLSVFKTLDLLDSRSGLVLGNTAFVLPVVTWILKNAIDTVPRDLDNAAKIDGCSPVSTLWRVIVPIVAPTMAAGAVIAFFHGWNEYIFAVSFLTDPGLQPMSVGLAGFIGEISTPVQTVMSVGMIYTLPAVALYLLLQRYIVSGMAAGSVKG